MKVLRGDADGLTRLGRWVLSSLAILDRIDWIDKRALEAWILQCQASTVLNVNCACVHACVRASDMDRTIHLFQRMDGWMDGNYSFVSTDGWMETIHLFQRMDGWMDGWMDGCIDGCRLCAHARTHTTASHASASTHMHARMGGQVERLREQYLAS